MMMYMLIKEGRIPPSELGIDMKQPYWSMRYLRTLGYIKNQEKKSMENAIPASDGKGLTYQISEEERNKL